MSVEPEWIRKQLRVLRAHGDELAAAADAVDEPDFGGWAGLKLIALSWTVDIYTTIMDSNNFDYYFVDALSGSGLVRLGSDNVPIAGSAILAGTVAPEPFERMYLVERDEERAAALDARLQYAADEIDPFELAYEDCVVINKNANDALPTIQDRVEDHRGTDVRGKDGEDGAHHLAFVDNQSHEVKFETIRELSIWWGDLLINYQEKNLNRMTGSKDRENWDELVAFYGTERVRRTSYPHQRREIYLDQLDSIDRPIHPNLPIEASGTHPYEYQMIYATQRTGGGSKYAQFIDNLKRKFDTLTGDTIDRVIETMQGENTTLDVWIDPDEDDEDDGPQDRQLNEFIE